eukprot:Rmarinus@m.7456
MIVNTLEWDDFVDNIVLFADQNEYDAVLEDPTASAMRISRERPELFGMYFSLDNDKAPTRPSGGLNLQAERDEEQRKLSVSCDRTTKMTSFVVKDIFREAAEQAKEAGQDYLIVCGDFQVTSRLLSWDYNCLSLSSHSHWTSTHSNEALCSNVQSLGSRIAPTLSEAIGY